MSEVARINVKCKERKVVLEGDNKEETCLIREMTGEDTESYMESMKDIADFSVDAKSGDVAVTNIKSFKGMQSNLLRRTLFHADGKKFSDEEINALSSTAMKDLFRIAQEMNALPEVEKEALKND